MAELVAPAQLQILRAYAAGRLGTRAAIERAGLDDYGDSSSRWRMPASTCRSRPWPEREDRIAAILQPLPRP